jgi:hypothetical protein
MIWHAFTLTDAMQGVVGGGDLFADHVRYLLAQ